MSYNEVLVLYENETVRSKAGLRKALPGDAGMDLHNASEQTITVVPHTSVEVPAGMRVKLPERHCALVYSRSSTFPKRGLFVVSSLIDCGYTGPVFVHVWHPNLNNMNRPVLIEPWERLAQLIVIPIPTILIREVHELPDTVRGDRGFGSTGM